MVKVSIIVPVYNVASYLERCLNSLVSQTLKDIEIILVNDGSTDNSEEIIKKYTKKDKRIIYLTKENGGQSSARNYGFKYANGEYIGYVDSDDWVSIDMYKKMYSLAKKNDADMVICSFFKAWDNGKLVRMSGLLSKSDDIKKNYIMSNPCPWNKIYKKEILNDKHWPEGMIYEDYAANPLLVTKLNKIEYLDQELYYYYIRDNSTMNMNSFNPKFYDILKATKYLTERIKKGDQYKNYIEEYEYTIISNLLRDPYFRLKNIEGSRELFNKIIAFIKQEYPNFMKNKYIQKESHKYRLITNLIYKQKYSMLKFINKLHLRKED